MVAAIVAVVLVGCKKDKKTPVQEANNNSENEPNIEVVDRKPIATMDMKTGEITYSFTIDQLTSVLNENRTYNDNYVVESFKIEPNSIPMPDSSYTALKIVILDTENEVSETHWLYGGFLDSKMDSQNIYYYLSEAVGSGNYTYMMKGKDAVSMNVQNGTITSIDTIENPDYWHPIFPWDVTCTTGPRCSECRKPFYKAGFHCECVNGYNPHDGMYCSETTSISNSLAIVGIVLSIFSLL